MANTYEDFERAARSAGLYNQFSPYDLQLAKANPDVGFGILSAKQSWNSASDDAGRAAANQRAESLRSNAKTSAGLTNYTGGSWGLEYNPMYDPTPVQAPAPSFSGGGAAALPSAPVTQYPASSLPASPTWTSQPQQSFDFSRFGSAPQYSSPYTGQINEAIGALGAYKPFEYDKEAPVWESRYDDRIQDALNKVTGYGPFSYEHGTDPVYQAYAKQYRREGERSMQGTLAQKAAQTGGVASSAAVAAAQQSQNYYNAQLADKIPELYSQAYARYLKDFSMQQDKLSQLQNAENNDWTKYRSDLSQFNTDRDFAFGVYQDAYNQLYNKFSALMSQDKNMFSQSEAQRDQWNADVDRAYKAYRDQIGDSQFDQRMAYQAARDAYDDAYKRTVLGYNQEQDAFSNAYNLSNAAYDREQDALDRDLAYAKFSAGSASGGVGSSGGGGYASDAASAYGIPAPAQAPSYSSSASAPGGKTTYYNIYNTAGGDVIDRVPERDAANMIDAGAAKMVRDKNGNVVITKTNPRDVKKVYATTR